MRRAAGVLVSAMTAAVQLPAQGLTADQVAGIRAGAAAVAIAGGTTISPLLGPPALPLVEVLIDGRGPFRFLVDLGSNVVLARQTVLEEIGIDPVLSRPGTDIFRVPSLTIGGAAYRDVWIGGVDSLDVDGVLGFNLLSLSDFELDYPGRRLVLGASATDRDDWHPYRVVDRLPYLDVRIGHSTYAVNFDTGATEWMTFPATHIDSLPLLGDPVSGTTAWNNQDGRQSTLIGRLATGFAFGPTQVENVTVQFSPANEDIWFGSGLLQHYRLRFDPVRRRVAIAGPRGILRPGARRTVGFAVDRRGHALIIRELVSGTAPASVLAVGDTLVAVDGIHGDSLASASHPNLLLASLAAAREMLGLTLGTSHGRMTRALPVSEFDTGPVIHGAIDPQLPRDLASARRRMAADRAAPAGAGSAPAGRVIFRRRTPAGLWASGDVVIEWGRWTQVSRHQPADQWVGGAGPYLLVWQRTMDDWRVLLDLW